jgi:hypothetical protein
LHCGEANDGVFNRWRIFSNTNDTLDGLKRELEARFDDVEIDVMGCVALFRARKGSLAFEHLSVNG